MSDKLRSTSGAPLSSAQLAACIAWAIVVALGGGLLCGWLMVRFGMPGALGLMILGIVAGVVAWQITRRGSTLVGCILVAAMLLAFVVANMFWLRYAELFVGQNAKTWFEAAKGVANLPNSARSHFFLSLVCAGFGAYNAFSAAGMRWFRVRE